MGAGCVTTTAGCPAAPEPPQLTSPAASFSVSLHWTRPDGHGSQVQKCLLQYCRAAELAAQECTSSHTASTAGSTSLGAPLLEEESALGAASPTAADRQLSNPQSRTEAAPGDAAAAVAAALASRPTAVDASCSGSGNWTLVQTSHGKPTHVQPAHQEPIRVDSQSPSQNGHAEPQVIGQSPSVQNPSYHMPNGHSAAYTASAASESGDSLYSDGILLNSTEFASVSGSEGYSSTPVPSHTDTATIQPKFVMSAKLIDGRARRLWRKGYSGPQTSTDLEGAIAVRCATLMCTAMSQTCPRDNRTASC